MPPRRAGALNEYSPSKIAIQILELQAIYYVAAVLFIFFTTVVMGTTFSLDLLLGWETLRGDTTTGWMLGFVWLSCAFVFLGLAVDAVYATSGRSSSSNYFTPTNIDVVPGKVMTERFMVRARIVAMLILVQRSKLVPDFALTLHGVHLVIVTMYSKSIPANSLWWGLQFTSAAFMTMGGIYACRWRELRPITFGGSAAAAPRGEAAETGGDEEAGFIRGSNRGRGGDGAGSYEMVEMKPDEEKGKPQPKTPRLD